MVILWISHCIVYMVFSYIWEESTCCHPQGKFVWFWCPSFNNSYCWKLKIMYLFLQVACQNAIPSDEDWWRSRCLCTWSCGSHWDWSGEERCMKMMLLQNVVWQGGVIRYKSDAFIFCADGGRKCLSNTNTSLPDYMAWHTKECNLCQTVSSHKMQ